MNRICERLKSYSGGHLSTSHQKLTEKHGETTGQPEIEPTGCEQAVRSCGPILRKVAHFDAIFLTTQDSLSGFDSINLMNSRLVTGFTNRGETTEMLPKSTKSKLIPTSCELLSNETIFIQ